MKPIDITSDHIWKEAAEAANRFVDRLQDERRENDRHRKQTEAIVAAVGSSMERSQHGSLVEYVRWTRRLSPEQRKRVPSAQDWFDSIPEMRAIWIQKAAEQAAEYRDAESVARDGEPRGGEVRVGYTDEERRVLRAMHKKRRTSMYRDDIAIEAELSATTTSEVLKELAGNGDVKKIGGRKGYALTPKGKETADIEVRRWNRAAGITSDVR